MVRKTVFILVMTGITAIVSAQGSKLTREEYIQKYKKIAIDEMARTGIPASIKIAQGMIESGNGNSTLAVKANNHFGIKCHDWNGRTIRHDDDSRRECFRRYGSAEESYRDHSDFLTSKSRYAGLFELSPTDYKAWAKGLKKAGYATSPTYADALIKIIEENKLYFLDQGVDISQKKEFLAQTKKSSPEKVKRAGGREILENNRVKYILAKGGDSYLSLTEELEILPWQLSKYNELPQDFHISEGQIIYIQPKRVNSDPTQTIHTVADGETMYHISQKYAIRLDKLYARNLMEPGTEPETGKKISLRGKINKKTRSAANTKEKINDEEKLKFEFDLDPN